MITFFSTFFCMQFKILRIPRSREVRQSWLSTLFTTLNALAFSFPVVLREKPELVKLRLNVKCSPLGDSRTYLCTTMNILNPLPLPSEIPFLFQPSGIPRFGKYPHAVGFPVQRTPLQPSEIQTKPPVIQVWIFSEITHCH